MNTKYNIGDVVTTKDGRGTIQEIEIVDDVWCGRYGIILDVWPSRLSEHFFPNSVVYYTETELTN